MGAFLYRAEFAAPAKLEPKALSLSLRVHSLQPMSETATWRSGYATVCKTVYPGSIPGVASIPKASACGVAVCASNGE